MKRLVRLTESDLTRIVRRVINEQAAMSDKDIAKSMYDSKGIFNDDEGKLVRTLKKIKSQQQWWSVTKELQKLAGMGPIAYMNSFMHGTNYVDTYDGSSVNQELQRIFGYGPFDKGADKKYPWNELARDASWYQTIYSSQG